MVTDTTVVNVNTKTTTRSRTDIAEIFVSGSETSVATFKLPDQHQNILNFIDSIDAVATMCLVDTMYWTQMFR